MQPRSSLCHLAILSANSVPRCAEPPSSPRANGIEIDMKSFSVYIVATALKKRISGMPQRFLPEWNGVFLALSQKRHGGMSFNRHAEKKVAQNRRRFLSELNLKLENCVAANLVHGNRVALVTANDRGRGAASADGGIPQTDALITAVPGLILTTTHADCAPVYFYSAKRRAVGLAHAGWRGILSALPSRVVEIMQKELTCEPDELNIAIGPTICTRHYPVGRDVAQAFQTRFGEIVLAHFDHRTHLNLAETIRCDLRSCGVPISNIAMPTTCTYCDPTLSSWRRDGKATTPMLALIV
ncbi:MAG: peptidoglycan editing factor PgeF, partial [Calditrichaeota bacterium]|nr:peptidoglycan editing factor PgeF [Calditrichota bacterium]